jgi:type I restriction enzyme M protein
VRDVFDGFGMTDLIADPDKSDRRYLIVKEFAAVDLHAKVVSSHADDSSEPAAARTRD